MTSLWSSPLPSEKRTRPGISKVFCHCVVAINRTVGPQHSHTGHELDSKISGLIHPSALPEPVSAKDAVWVTKGHLLRWHSTDGGRSNGRAAIPCGIHKS